jgi:hypothetical protein
MCSAAVGDAEFRFQGKEPLRRSWRRRKGKMKIDFREIGCDDMKCIGQAQYGPVVGFWEQGCVRVENLLTEVLIS